MHFSDFDYEAVSLKAITGSLDSMMNHELFEVTGEAPHSNIFFVSAIHQRLFNVLLVDFLEKMDAELTGMKASSLGVLLKICAVTKLSDASAIITLRDAVNMLSNWLNEEVLVETWLPSIEKQLDLKITRKDFVWACGNISKHNLSRLTGVSKRLVSILERNGLEVSRQEALSVLDDFYERFHTDIFNYHASSLAEMLNNIRWGIHEYLLPEYQRSYTRDPDDKLRYSFDVPTGLVSEFGRSCYWDLMHEVRRGPYVQRFVVTKYLKLRY